MHGTSHTQVRKAVFMFLNIFAYALRPMIVKPDLVPKDRKIALNWAIQLSYDAALFAEAWAAYGEKTLS